MKTQYDGLSAVLIAVALCLLGSGGFGMIDNLQIVFNPDGRSQQFNLEEQVDVQVAFNSPAQATIILPRTHATELLNGNSAVRITYNNRVLFDGTCQKKQFADKTITLSAYDDLWFVDRIRRSFTQSTTDLTASQAVTAAFDQDSDFSEFGSAITFYESSYTTPFYADIDATTYVIPCDIAFACDEAFNGNNVSGLKFLDDMTKMAKRGDTYRYYYWLDYLNGQQYLHFEPEGWGYLWEWLENCSVIQQLTETFENLWNNIIVWGEENRQYLPSDKDAWTETSIDGWFAEGTVNTYSRSQQAPDPLVPADDAQVGDYTLKFTMTSDAGADNAGIYRRNVDGWNLESLTEIHFDYKASTANFHELYLMVSTLGVGIDFAIVTADIIDTNWHSVTFTKADFGAFFGTTDWSHINYISFYIGINAANAINDYILFDGLYFAFDPIRSQNSSATGITTGYDATSIELYGERQATITNSQLYYITDCNLMAQSLCNYFKDPEYLMGIQMPYFWNGHLNDRVKDQWYQLDHTFTVSKIKWSFTADGIQTALTLGTERLSMDDLIKKLYDDTVSLQYDNGSNVAVV